MSIPGSAAFGNVSLYTVGQGSAAAIPLVDARVDQTFSRFNVFTL